jgi:hypothetical protein
MYFFVKHLITCMWYNLSIVIMMFLAVGQVLELSAGRGGSNL